MKKFFVILAALVMSVVVNVQQTEAKEDIVKVSGTITEVKQDSLVVENQEKLQTIFTITKDVYIYDSGTTEPIEKESLEPGTMVEVYYDNTIPRIMIYPPVITPEVVVVQNGGHMKVATFDKNLVSADGQLKLNLTEDSVIESENGEKVGQNELAGKQLVVFYTVSTKSIPAQATPTKVIVLGPNVEKLIEEDHFMQNGTKMLPLKKVAKALDYDVIWQQATKTVLVKKQNQTFLITPGDTEYSLNKSLQSFKEAPVIIDGKTYVSEEFLAKLTK